MFMCDEQERDALNLLKISGQKLVSYLTHVEENYNHSNSYHNSIHAADVTQTSHYLLRLTSLQVGIVGCNSRGITICHTFGGAHNTTESVKSEIKRGRP